VLFVFSDEYAVFDGPGVLSSQDSFDPYNTEPVDDGTYSFINEKIKTPFI